MNHLHPIPGVRSVPAFPEHPVTEGPRDVTVFLCTIALGSDRQFCKKYSLTTENALEMGLGDAVWADFCSKINSETSPIDLDGVRRDPADPEIQKNSRKPRIDNFRR